VTTLTVRHVRPAWRRSSPICWSEALLGIKARSSPRRFFTTAESLFFLSFPFPARSSCLRPVAHFAPATPLFPTEGYDASSQKNASSQLPALIRSSRRQYCLVDHYGRGSSLEMRPTRCLAFQVPADLFTQQPGIPRPPLSSPSYVSTVIDKCRINTLTGCLTDNSLSTDLQRGWFGERKG
jgi:hypothetical protein